MHLRSLRAAPFALVAFSLLVACSSGGSDENSSSSDEALTLKCGASASGSVQGYDISYYQGDFGWSGRGVQFGVARISDGTKFPDPDFDTNYARIKAAGLVRGTYQYFQPDQDEVEQANIVIAKVGKLGDGDLPVQFDLETTAGQSPATIQRKAKHWLELVEAGTGKKPFVYSYASFLQDNLGSGFGAYPLWIAGYDESCPDIPSGWSNWVIWQYSDGDGKLDHDVFNGTEAELRAFAGASTAPAPLAPALSGVSAVTWGDERLDAFVRGTNNALYHKYWNGKGWVGFEDLGGEITSNPVAVSWAKNRIDIFARGGNGALVHKYFDGAWRGFEDLGGDIVGNPAVVSWGENRLDVFVRGTNDALYHKYWNGKEWSGFEDFGGNITSDPVAVSWASGRLDVFARGANAALYHKYWDGQWGDFEDLGGGIVGDPSVVSWGENRLDVFVRGTDDALFHKFWDGSAWSGYEDFGGKITSDPLAVSWGVGRLDVFARGDNPALYHKFFNGKSWNDGFEDLGGGIDGDPAVVSWGSNRIDLFLHGTNDALYHRAFQSSWGPFQDLGGAVGP